MDDNQKHEYFFNLWCKYEDITNHFNGLILKIRIQALALVTTLITLVVLLGHNDKGVQWDVVFVVFLFLSFFWVSIAILDLGYYNRLMTNSVKELEKLEKSRPIGTDLPEPIFSTSLHRSVGSTLPAYSFYIVVFVVFIISTAVSSCNAWG
ncbi:hypothetical protein [Thalassotalea castellviae]|uniref:Uncharacterized protein n=1 Tax=Thalassotalea castellviae TaxID=3075612 RepID=A0ABU2ZYV7_9GAMM|nr:hypothetical protein [Thalassotalea sp. W431]MDT0603099.1 hypothetical protein [Thalassotalea sp. W431]